MQAVVPHGAETFASGSDVSIELAIVGVAAVLLIVVLLLRNKRIRDQQLRRGASVGYYDRDVAHYAQRSPDTQTVGAPLDPSSQPMAPSFVSSPKESKKHRGKTPGPVAPRPVPSFAPNLVHAGPVPAFDQTVAQGLRPVPKMPPPPPPQPPRQSEPEPEPAEPLPPLLAPPAPVAEPLPALPRLDQPLPPPPTRPEDTTTS
jgi:hypothetical protein